MNISNQQQQKHHNLFVLGIFRLFLMKSFSGLGEIVENICECVAQNYGLTINLVAHTHTHTKTDDIKSIHLNSTQPPHKCSHHINN